MTVKEKTIERLLYAVGSSIHGGVGNKIKANCPFGHKHSGGYDKNPSFAFFKGESGWRYNCFSCGSRGGLYKMLWELLPYYGRRPHFLAVWTEIYDTDQLDVEDRTALERLDYGIGGKFSKPKLLGKTKVVLPAKQSPTVPLNASSRPAPINTPLNDTEAICGKTGRLFDMPVEDTKPTVEILPKGTEDKWKGSLPIWYLFERNIFNPDESVAEYNLKYDDKTRRLMFPVYNLDQELVGYTGRLMWEQDHCFKCGKIVKTDGSYVHKCRCGTMYPKYLHKSGNWRRNSLFGIHRHKENVPIIIVEGPMDAVVLQSHGAACPVAILGANINRGQVQLIAERTQHVLVMGDGDEAGRRMNRETKKAIEDYADEIGKEMDVRFIDLDEGLDPGTLTNDQFVQLLAENSLIDKSEDIA